MSISLQKILTKVFGSRNERLLKRYRTTVEKINAWEPEIQAKTDEALRQRTKELQEGLVSGKLRSDDVLPEAFAIIRESMDRNIGIRQIFNPEETFDPDQLDDEHLELYDSVQRRMIQTGEPWTHVPIPPQLYAAVRRIYPESRPPFRARCFDVQLIGGLVLYEGKIAEMATGEGKTFVAPLACYMRVLEGLHCHVVTVNDYLVRRDANWVRPAFENLGISVAFIQQDMEPGGEVRRRAYQSDITYGTNSEFGFDFLRDNMKERVDLQVQGPLEFVIVDEVDSILIDEARTPLIISGAAHDDAQKYRESDRVARKIMELNKPWTQLEKQIDAAQRAIKAAEGDIDKHKGDKEEIEKARRRRDDAERQLGELESRKPSLVQYYEVEWDRKSVHLTHEGIEAAQQEAGVGSFYTGSNMEWPHLMEQALRAHVVYERDKDYVVERGPRGEMEVVIVDEYTGRKMVGRQWSDGLHQAVEAKERVPIKQETQTLATITLQNFFKLYKAMAGMTGTAQTEAEEFSKIYRLEVVTIPTNRPVVRADHDDRVYRTAREKWESIIEEIKDYSEQGRPVLVGTTSVEKSEMLSNLLTRKYGVKHNVLNAKQHEREAHIITEAGQQHVNAHGKTAGNVTIATNMAGRGTDIKLTPETTKAGGLHVIGTERHTARRIDNQLRGRGGRQGDPGSSRFYVSLEDDLMKMFAGEWTIKVLGFLGMEEGMHIEDKRITKGILRAQKKVEERNFLARKNLLEYDEVMDYQRTSFYGMRQKVLEGREIDKIIWDMIGEAIQDAVRKYIEEDYVSAVISEWARANFRVSLEPEDLRGLRTLIDLESYIKGQARNEVEHTVNTSLGEYLGEDRENKEWDTRGLASWAMSEFQVNLSQSQVRKMEADEIEEMIKEAAIEQIDRRDVSGLNKYLAPLFAESELANWARDKFGITIDPAEIVADAERHIRKPAAEIVAIIEQRAREAYAQREMEYPVDHLLAFTFGGEDGKTDNPYAADYVRAWTKMKFREELSLEEIRGVSVRRLRDRLIGFQEQYLEDGRLEKEIDAIVQANSDPASLAKAFNERFGAALAADELQDLHGQAGAGADRTGSSNGDGRRQPLRERLLHLARGFFRRELTDLEQFVLIQIFDQSWKDHLYAMDMLRAGIGLQAFAERDPRIIYKKEGYRYFNEMMESIRDKVTDLIFRARIVGQVQARNAYQVTSARHDQIEGYGAGENVAAANQLMGAGESAQQASAAEAGQTATITKPIQRDAPKIGRNDPCPCGSGRKYKKCCGANAA